MTPDVIAVTAGDTIVKFGAYAGFAAIVGLAVMSMLYFAQAREVKRLREWAGRAPERDAEIALRVQSDAQRRVVATPMAPATTAAQQAEAARTAAAAALYAKVPPPPPPPAPLVGPPGQLARPVVPGPVPGAVPGAVPSQAAAPTTTSAPGATTPTPAPGSVPGALTPAAAAAAAAAPSAFANGAGGQDTHESAAARPDPLEGPPPGRFSDTDDDDGGFGFSAARTGAIVGGAVAAVLVAVVLMVALNQDDSPSKPNELGVVTQPAAASPAAGGTSTNGGTTTAPAAVDRRGTRVAVLNGTTQTGLARAVADQVEKARFTIAATATNADQAVPTTTVSYRAGDQRAAQIVAQVIGVGSDSVRPVDANSTAAADADVVVIVGADKIG
jgi:hypothetical protein